MFTNEKITRTFSFTRGIAKVYDEKTDSLVDKEFSIVYSTLNDTPEKIQRKVDKALKTRTTALKNVHRVDELYSMPVELFLKYAKLEKVDGENVENA